MTRAAFSREEKGPDLHGEPCPQSRRVAFARKPSQLVPQCGAILCRPRDLLDEGGWRAPKPVLVDASLHPGEVGRDVRIVEEGALPPGAAALVV